MRIFKSWHCSVFIIGIFLSTSGNAQSVHFRCGDLESNSSLVADYFKFKDSSLPGSKDSIRPYVELNDGTKIYGKSISIILSGYPKAKIKIDSNEYRIKDTRGFFDGTYSARTDNRYAKRSVTGKINLYRENFRLETSIVRPGTYYGEGCLYYAQKGDGTELIKLTTYDDIKGVVKDCPKAYALINKKYNQLQKAMKENPAYLSEIFSIYNNGCK